MNFRTLAVVLLAIGYVSGASANEDELNGVPKEYWDLKNPLTATDENLGDGKALYEAFCVRCHGVHGLADGPDSDKFNPPPAALGYTINMPVSTDPFLYWSIFEGGHEFGTAMPEFDRQFEPDEIWKIILYLRSGFSTADKDG